MKLRIAIIAIVLIGLTVLVLLSSGRKDNDEELLLYAIKDGKLEKVKRLVERNPDLLSAEIKTMEYYKLSLLARIKMRHNV